MARRAHVDARAGGAPDAPQLRRRPVAQRRARPGGEHRGRPPCLPTQRSVADCIDASVQRPQPSKTDAVLDRAGSEAEVEELRTRHDTVLPRCERGDRLVRATRRTFGLHITPNMRLDRHPPMVAIRASPITAQTQRFCGTSVAELRAPARHVLPKLSVDRVVDRGLLVLLERLAPDLSGALRRVAPAVARPAVEVLRRAQERPVEAFAEALER